MEEEKIENPQIVEEEEPEKITEPITKKDPKKVEQGKRLAAISKQAKEEKMRRKIKEEDFSYFPYIIYGIAGFSTFGLLYLLVFGEKQEEIHPITIIKEEPKTEEGKKLKKKFEGFD